MINVHAFFMPRNATCVRMQRRAKITYYYVSHQHSAALWNGARNRKFNGHVRWILPFAYCFNSWKIKYKTLRTTRCLKIYSVFKGGNFTNALLKSALHFIWSSHFLKIEHLLDTFIIRIEFENFFLFSISMEIGKVLLKNQYLFVS